MLIKKLLTKDYFRRISWIELFGYKIDDEGNYIDQDSLNKSPYNNSNKSYSTIKDESDGKGGIKEESFSVTDAEIAELKQTIIQSAKEIISGEFIKQPCTEEESDYYKYAVRWSQK